MAFNAPFAQLFRYSVTILCIHIGQHNLCTMLEEVLANAQTYPARGPCTRRELELPSVRRLPYL